MPAGLSSSNKWVASAPIAAKTTRPSFNSIILRQGHGKHVRRHDGSGSHAIGVNGKLALLSYAVPTATREKASPLVVGAKRLPHTMIGT